MSWDNPTLSKLGQTAGLPASPPINVPILLDVPTIDQDGHQKIISIPLIGSYPPGILMIDRRRSTAEQFAGSLALACLHSQGCEAAARKLAQVCGLLQYNYWHVELMQILCSTLRHCLHLNTRPHLENPKIAPYHRNPCSGKMVLDLMSAHQRIPYHLARLALRPLSLRMPLSLSKKSLRCVNRVVNWCMLYSARAKFSIGYESVTLQSGSTTRLSK